jgi:hypothetical protein
VGGDLKGHLLGALDGTAYFMYFCTRVYPSRYEEVFDKFWLKMNRGKQCHCFLFETQEHI